MDSGVKLVLIIIFLALLHPEALSAQAPSGSVRVSQATELKKIGDALKDVESSIARTNGTLKGLDSALEQVNKNLTELRMGSHGIAGVTLFEWLLLILTLLYTVATGFLWQTTKSQVKLARDGYEQAKTASIAAMLQQLGANDRAIKSLLVQDPTIYSPLERKIDPLGGKDHPEGDRRLRAYIGVVINHVKHVFLQEQLRQLPPNYWEAVDRDLDASIRVPQFREVWERIAPFQPREFRDYVDGKIRASEATKPGGTAR